MDLSQSIQILCVILVLLAMVCWFFSAKTWRWHTLTMVILNFMAAMAIVYLGMRSLKTNREWRNEHRNASLANAKEDQIKHDLVEGTKENQVEAAGIHQLKNDIDRVTLGRGRVWRDLDVQSKEGLTITVKWKGTEPHGLPDKSVVFLFDDRREVGATDPHYLGEFKVKSGKDNDIELSLAAPSTQKERENIVNAAQFVVAYETMPMDDPDWYLDGKPDKIRDGLVAKLPPETQEELKKKDRPLRNYVYVFDDIRRQMAIVKAESDQLLREIEALRLSNAQVQAAIVAEDAEGKALATDFARFKQENAAITAYADQLETKRQELVGQLNAIFVKNRNMANEITALNAKAIEALNRHSATPDEPTKTNSGGDKAASAFLKAQ